MVTITEAEAWRALATIADPEIPVVNVVEMGIVRRVDMRPDCIAVHMTPTFSGCPALDVMRDDIVRTLRALGARSVRVVTLLHPPWSSDWISDAAREKLRAFGLAPPPKHGNDTNVILLDAATCPRCGSANTALKNAFGSTLCRSIFVCNVCREPFEQFKPI